MKNKKRNIIIIVVLSLLVAYLSLRDNFTEKIKYLFSINPTYLILSFVLVIIYWIIKGIALCHCVRQVEKKYTKKQGIKLLITTQLFHAITPFASGGQPWQIYRLKKEGIPISKGTNIVIEDFVTYQIALILLGVVAVVSNHIFHIIPQDNSLNFLVALGFIFNVIIVLFSFLVAFNKKMNRIIVRSAIKILSKFRIVKNEEESLEKAEKHIQLFHDSAQILLKNKMILFRIILLNFIALAVLYSIPFTLMLGLEVYVNPFYVIVTSAYVMLIDSLIPTPGSTGGLEYGFMSFFETHVQDPKLTIIMIVWRIITYYFGIFVGLLLVNTYKEEKE